MAIEEMGFEVVRTRVGDPAISVALRDGGDFGGEPSGSWIFPRLSLCPDGIFAAAQAVAIASQQRLSQLVDSIPSYPVLRGNVSSQGVVIAELEQRLKDMKAAAVNNTDGIRLDFKDGWMLIRPSGTEPKIRLTVEAKEEKRARQIYEAGVNAINKSTRT
jgi:phosphoglucosamine mutase